MRRHLSKTSAISIAQAPLKSMDGKIAEPLLKLIVTLIYEISQFDWTVSPSCEDVKVL